MRQGIKSTVTGNIVRVQPIRSVGSGKDQTVVLNFDVASNNRLRKDQDKPDATYIHVSAFGRDAQELVKTLKPGKPMQLTGRLEMRSFTRADNSTGQGLDMRLDTNGYEYIFSAPRKDDEQPPSPSAQTDSSLPGNPIEMPVIPPASSSEELQTHC